jgi:hypothetical protein
LALLAFLLATPIAPIVLPRSNAITFFAAPILDPRSMKSILLPAVLGAVVTDLFRWRPGAQDRTRVLGGSGGTQIPGVVI